MNTRVPFHRTTQSLRLSLPVFFFSLSLLSTIPLNAQPNTHPQAERQHAASPPNGVAAYAQPDSTPGLYNPVADPHAVVTVRNARFTVLTPQMIRMEWAADGKFEDHPSFVFLNRRLAVPKFTSSVTKGGTNQSLVLKTGALALSYVLAQNDDGKFTSDNLHIDFVLNGKQVSWH